MMIKLTLNKKEKNVEATSSDVFFFLIIFYFEIAQESQEVAKLVEVFPIYPSQVCVWTAIFISLE